MSARTVHTTGLVGGPVLAGVRVGWTVLTPKSFKVETQRGSAPPETIGHMARVQGELPRARMASSPALIGVEAISGVHGNDTALRAVLAGPPAGPLSVLERECPAAGASRRTIDVSDDELLYMNCDAEPTVRDFGSGATEPLPANGAGLRIAGRYAAWLQGSPNQPSVVVYDRSLASVVYTVPASAMPYGVADLDLEPSGTVAIAFATHLDRRGSFLERVGWASIEEPVLHRTPARAAEHYNVRIASDRIGFMRGRELAENPSNLTLGYVGIHSPHERIVVARGGEDQLLEDRFDFDGQRFAWYSFGCRDTIVHVATASSHIRGDRHCRLRLTQRPTVVKRHRVRLAVNCFGFAGGVCEARPVRITRSERLLAVGRLPGAVTLTSRGRKLVRTHKHSVRVRISAVLRDDAGRREPRTTPARLRIP